MISYIDAAHLSIDHNYECSAQYSFPMSRHFVWTSVQIHVPRSSCLKDIRRAFGNFVVTICHDAIVVVFAVVAVLVLVMVFVFAEV